MKIFYRALKYVLNLIGFVLMFMVMIMSFELIAGPVLPDQAEEITINVVKDILLFYSGYLVVITIFNYLVERRLEKRISREFMILLFVQLLALALVVWMGATAQYDFWKYPESY
jgi:hypothetical protein